MAGGENARAALDYTKHYRSPRMIGSDADYGVMQAYQSTGWPRFVIIDREGTIQFHGFASDQTLSNLRQCLQKLVSAQGETPDPALAVRDGMCYLASVVEARAARRDRSPRLAVDARGRPWVAYYSNRDGDNNIHLRHPNADGTLADEVLAGNSGDDYAPDCAFDSSGTLWVTWCSNRNGQYDIYVQSRRPGEAAETAQLSHSDDDAMRPRIAAGPDGRLTVAYYKWRRMGGAGGGRSILSRLAGQMNAISRDRDIFARVYDPASGQWGAETEISPHLPEVEDHTDPDLVIDGRGNAWVAWSYDYHPQLFPKPLDTDQPSVFAASLEADRKVSPPILAGTVGRRSSTIDLFPSVAIDGNGTLWCAWDAYDFGRPGRKVRLAQLDQAQFKPAFDLTAPGTVCSTPEISPGRDGTLLASWSERTGDVWQGKVVILRERKRIAETTLDAGPADVLFPQAQQGSDGRIWVVYESCSAAGSEVVLKDLTKELATSGF